ncbi:MAG: hypothetical protein M1837_003083 [Sclerophora amabilis]|nr:MAG: hypothetical protein M1837_003083 [Sclerophora amabilis]
MSRPPSDFSYATAEHSRPQASEYQRLATFTSEYLEVPDQRTPLSPSHQRPLSAPPETVNSSTFPPAAAPSPGLSSIPEISFPVPSQPVRQDPQRPFDFGGAIIPRPPPVSYRQPVHRSREGYMSTYSSSSQDSIYSTPGARKYRLYSPAGMKSPQKMTQTEKAQLIRSLHTHRVNTLTELRRIERVLADVDQQEFCEPMTSAWAHYVNSNNLLNELRGLTKSYPFSSECLDEAKWKVIEDPSSQRSWNYCWLVLTKIENEQLIVKHATSMAQQPSMWGNRTPTPVGISQLANAFVSEWTRALRQMLRHWEAAPSAMGH